MAIYFDDNGIIIRSMKQTDAQDFFEAFSAQGWHKPVELFKGYYEQQENGERRVIVAEVNDTVAGYVTLLPKAESGPYASLNIPEIVDFNVLLKYQKRGIGNKVMDITEQLASESCKSVCLSVGMHYGYGTAQRMYVKRGYIPHGSGVWYKGKQVEQYSPCVNDDDLVLYMKKDFPVPG